MVHMTTTLLQEQPAPQKGIGINPGLNVVIKMAPAASKEDSHHKGILKFHRPSSFDYRARHRLPVTNGISWVKIVGQGVTPDGQFVY